MSGLPLAASVFVVLLATAASATHVPDCIPGEADPTTYNRIDLRPYGGSLYYDEERGNPFGTEPVIPMSGFFFGPDMDGDGIPELLQGEGTWIWEETNGLDGLQRSGPPPFPPGCTENADFDLSDGEIPCFPDLEDPITDWHCGHGFDRLIL